MVRPLDKRKEGNVSDSVMTGSRELKVIEALIEDAGKGWARLSSDDMKALGVVLGDLVEIRGKKKTVARVTGIPDEHCGKQLIQIDGITRYNAQANAGSAVQVRKVPRKTANQVVLYPLDLNSPLPHESELEYFGKVLQGMPVIVDDKINIPLFGGKDRFFRIEATSPSGAVIINQYTVLKRN
jgi:transitional endoplasmic reticulum ATPase